METLVRTHKIAFPNCYFGLMLYIACCTKRMQLALLSRWLNRVNILRFMSIYSVTVRIYLNMIEYSC
jgi:hypothetical protein